jgi:hypothetical protein
MVDIDSRINYRDPNSSPVKSGGIRWNDRAGLICARGGGQVTEWPDFPIERDISDVTSRCESRGGLGG